MANELYGGSLKGPNTFADSMAEEIEKAFDEVLAEVGFPKLPDPSTANENDLNNRRILFIAIARGVINHLKQNEGAFHLTVTGGGHSHIDSNGEHSQSGQATIQVK